MEQYDLIFNGKNEAYSTYKMRKDSPRRHNITVVLVIMVTLIGFSIPTLIKMATPKQKEAMTEVTTLSRLEKPGVEQEEIKCIEPVVPSPSALKGSIKFTAPVIKKGEEVRDRDEVKSQAELTKVKVATSIADVKGNDEANGRDIADLKRVMTQAPGEGGKMFDMIEQMPTFPSRANELMKYIVDHLKYPTITQENGVEGRVVCQFVVSSDGRVRDAKAVKTLDPYYDEGVIRVVMSMPKWMSGKQNDKAISMEYTVPTVFKLQ